MPQRALAPADLRCIARSHAWKSTVSDLQILKPLVLPKLARGEAFSTSRPADGPDPECPRCPHGMSAETRIPGVLGGGRLEGDLVAEGLELGDGSLAGAVAVAPDEEVAAKVVVVAVLGK